MPNEIIEAKEKRLVQRNVVIKNQTGAFNVYKKLRQKSENKIYRHLIDI